MLIDLLAPMACPVCDAENMGCPICPECRNILDTTVFRCPRCAMPTGPWAHLDKGCSVCRGRRLGFDAAVTLGTYKGSVRKLCLLVKHQPNAWLTRWLADLFVERRGLLLTQEVQDGILPLVIPIPLHWRRRFGRGYNQADALATRIARGLGFPLSRCLRRIKNTAPLAGKRRTERLEEMRDVFRVKPAELKGRTILLVDDILTSGATCGSAARALKKAGAKRVVVVVIARA